MILIINGQPFNVDDDNFFNGFVGNSSFGTTTTPQNFGFHFTFGFPSPPPRDDGDPFAYVGAKPKPPMGPRDPRMAKIQALADDERAPEGERAAAREALRRVIDAS